MLKGTTEKAKNFETELTLELNNHIGRVLVTRAQFERVLTGRLVYQLWAFIHRRAAICACCVRWNFRARPESSDRSKLFGSFEEELLR